MYIYIYIYVYSCICTRDSLHRHMNICTWPPPTPPLLLSYSRAGAVSAVVCKYIHESSVMLLICMSHWSCQVYEWVLGHVTEMNELWCMSHVWDMSHVTYMNESRVMSQIRMIPCHMYETWVMSRICTSPQSEWDLSHVTYTNEPWVMSCTYMSHVTYINESCHVHKWVMSRT